ncbi:MAG TPA: YggS family pyridoxal phosphate-dependent enzyme [Desulfobacteria bacterium]|nr:YggS family pyridoxal phosphate-dependent enzyme [Desulfobacteria bacterium]
MSLIADNLAAVKERMAEAARKAGRKPNAVRLVAVSKTVPVERIAEAGAMDGCVFGENKVQEARDKIEALRKESYHWHFIGHLQRNKVKYIPGLFELIHSVDNSELAEEIHRHSLKHNLVTPVLIQVNVSGETSKSGVNPGDLEELLEMLVSLNGISVRGLMTIPPFDPDPEKSRKHFAALRKLRDRMLKVNIENIAMDELSMGMSNDFEVAIEEGATWVRVGTAIFGDRTTR